MAGAHQRSARIFHDGTYVDEVRIAPATLGDGSTWDIAFSTDPEQTYMYLANGKNMKVYIMEKFLFRGVGPIPSENQGAPWPSRGGWGRDTP